MHRQAPLLGARRSEHVARGDETPVRFLHLIAQSLDAKRLPDLIDGVIDELAERVERCRQMGAAQAVTRALVCEREHCASSLGSQMMARVESGDADLSVQRGHHAFG